MWVLRWLPLIDNEDDHRSRYVVIHYGWWIVRMTMIHTWCLLPESRWNSFTVRPFSHDLTSFLNQMSLIAHQIDGPSKVNFVVDLLGLPSSGWNCKVAQIFTEDFMAVGSYARTDKADIRKRFTRHMAYLIKKYKQQQNEMELNTAKRQSVAARRRRKLSVSIWSLLLWQ